MKQETHRPDIKISSLDFSVSTNLSESKIIGPSSPNFGAFAASSKANEQRLIQNEKQTQDHLNERIKALVHASMCESKLELSDMVGPQLENLNKRVAENSSVLRFIMQILPKNPAEPLLLDERMAKTENEVVNIKTEFTQLKNNYDDKIAKVESITTEIKNKFDEFKNFMSDQLNQQNTHVNKVTTEKFNNSLDQALQELKEIWKKKLKITISDLNARISHLESKKEETLIQSFLPKTDRSYQFSTSENKITVENVEGLEDAIKKYCETHYEKLQESLSEYDFKMIFEEIDKRFFAIETSLSTKVEKSVVSSSNDQLTECIRRILIMEKKIDDHLKILNDFIKTSHLDTDSLKKQISDIENNQKTIFLSQNLKNSSHNSVPLNSTAASINQFYSGSSESNLIKQASAPNNSQSPYINNLNGPNPAFNNNLNFSGANPQITQSTPTLNYPASVNITAYSSNPKPINLNSSLSQNDSLNKSQTGMDQQTKHKKIFDDPSTRPTHKNSHSVDILLNSNNPVVLNKDISMSFATQPPREKFNYNDFKYPSNFEQSPCFFGESKKETYPHKQESLASFYHVDKIQESEKKMDRKNENLSPLGRNTINRKSPSVENEIIEMIINEEGYVVDEKGNIQLDDDGKPIKLSSDEIDKLKNNNLYEEIFEQQLQ